MFLWSKPDSRVHTYMIIRLQKLEPQPIEWQPESPDFHRACQLRYLVSLSDRASQLYMVQFS